MMAAACAVPTRAAPASTMVCTSTSVSMRPDALTETASGRHSRSSSTSATGAAPSRPAELVAKSAPEAATMRPASRMRFSSRCDVSSATLTRTCPLPEFTLFMRTACTSAASSLRTARKSPASIAPTLTTTSISPAPPDAHRSARLIFDFAGSFPSGPPITAQTFTSQPRRCSTAASTTSGSTHTAARWCSRASAHTRATSAGVASGSRRAWSSVLARSSRRSAMGDPTESKTLDADRVPDRLQLEKRARVPRRLSVAVTDDTLHVLRGQLLELGAIAVDTRQVERVDVHVPGEHRHELRLVPSEDVDDTARHVGGREHLGERDGGQWPAFGGDHHRRVPADDGGREPEHEAFGTRLLGRDDAGDAHRLGDREVEVGAGDGVRRAEDLGELVRPARVPDPRVDGGIHLLRAAGQLGELRASALHDLGYPVQHLSAVVRGHRRPFGKRLARGANSVAKIL